MNTTYINAKLKEYLPKHQEKYYKPVHACIYCGSTEDLSDEHIIPFGIGGKVKLPQSSCAKCSKKTSAFEHTCLRTMYGPLRLLYGLPSRRKKSRPKMLPLKVKIKESADWTFMDVEQEKYSFLILFPYFPMPNLLSKVKSKNIHNATSDRLWIRGASPSYVFKDLLQQLTQDLKVFAVQPEAKAHMPEFCQMLSKVAYSFAAAEFGFNNFIPFVIPYIIDANLKNCGNCIGSLKNEEPPSDHLHELSIDKDAKYITVRVRLLAKLGTPTYYVVVGEHYNKGE